MASRSSSNSSSPTASSSPVAVDLCAICLYDLSPTCGRTVVTLRCSHSFHLDCIGSAFNSKRAMECPNCRVVEPGQWQWQFSERRWRVPDPDMNNVREAQMVPEYQWCPNHGWGWAVHTAVVGGPVEENHERVIITDMDGPRQAVQQQNSAAVPTAAANQTRDVNAAPDTASADSLPQGSGSNGAGRVTAIPYRFPDYSRFEVGESSRAPRDSRAHNDGAPPQGAANDVAPQVNDGAGSSNNSPTALALDFVPRGALEALGRRSLLTTHYVATPVEGAPDLFRIWRSYQFARRNQRRGVAALGDALRNMAVADPAEPAAPGENGRVPDEEAAATEVNGVDANQEPSN